ncbi:MAG TPA: phage tail protein [Candidatus Limnocylindria bacterium]|nr:phage tail protein [Candidatus Limnocylindria bacterium]
MDETKSTTSRRRFLGTAAGATGVAIASTVWNASQAAAALVPNAREATPADARTFVGGRFFFNLDGVKCGFLKSVEGGNTYADVVTQQVGATGFAKKHIGQPKYEDLTLQIGFSMSKAVYDWISATWNMNYMRKSGSIQAADYQGDVKATREFFNALITETGIPACDGSSKEPGYLRLRFAPEFARNSKTGGSLDSSTPKPQKTWLPSNFRLEIDGLDCTKVNKIDSFTVKQTVATDDIGETRDYLREPGKLEFPNLKITLAQASSQSWFDWFEEFVIKGNNVDSDEKSGRLVFLSADLKTELARITFFNMGIFKISQPSQSSSDTIPRVTAELYVERMEFTVNPGGA